MAIDLSCLPVPLSWAACGLVGLITLFMIVRGIVYVARGPAPRIRMSACAEHRGRASVSGRVVADDGCDQSVLNGRGTPWMNFWAVRGRRRLAAAETRGAITLSDGTGGVTIDEDQAEVKDLDQRRCILAVAEAGAERRLRERFKLEVGFPENTETVLKETALLVGDQVVAFGRLRKGAFVGPVVVSPDLSAEVRAHKRGRVGRLIEALLVGGVLAGAVYALPVSLDQVRTGAQRERLFEDVQQLFTRVTFVRALDDAGQCLRQGAR